MKRVGFRKINIGWDDPFIVFSIIFIIIGIIIAIILTALSEWEDGWLVPTIFGGAGILFGIVGHKSPSR